MNQRQILTNPVCPSQQPPTTRDPFVEEPQQELYSFAEKPQQNPVSQQKLNYSKETGLPLPQLQLPLLYPARSKKRNPDYSDSCSPEKKKECRGNILTSTPKDSTIMSDETAAVEIVRSGSRDESRGSRDPLDNSRDSTTWSRDSASSSTSALTSVSSSSAWTKPALPGNPFLCQKIVSTKVAQLGITQLGITTLGTAKSGITQSGQLTTSHLKLLQSLKQHPLLGGSEGNSFINPTLPDIPITILLSRLEHLIGSILTESDENQQIKWAVATFLDLIPWNPPALSHATLSTVENWADFKKEAAQIGQQIQKKNCGCPIMTAEQFIQHWRPPRSCTTVSEAIRFLKMDINSSFVPIPLGYLAQATEIAGLAFQVNLAPLVKKWCREIPCESDTFSCSCKTTKYLLRQDKSMVINLAFVQSLDGYLSGG